MRCNLLEKCVITILKLLLDPKPTSSDTITMGVVGGENKTHEASVEQEANWDTSSGTSQKKYL